MISPSRMSHPATAQPGLGSISPAGMSSARIPSIERGAAGRMSAAAATPNAERSDGLQQAVKVTQGVSKIFQEVVDMLKSVVKLLQEGVGLLQSLAKFGMNLAKGAMGSVMGAMK